MFWNKKKEKTEKKPKSRKKRNNSNIDLLKNQKYLLKITLPEDLLPENNSEVKKIINKISVLEKETENDFESTFPYGSFKAVDKFLKDIRDLSIHADQQNIYLKSLELDTWEGDSSKKKIIEVTTLESVEIKYNFETILQIIFEEVVNDNETGLDVDTLKEFLSDLRDTYIKNTGVSSASLPEVPDEQVFLSKDEYYHFIIPNLNKSEKSEDEEQKSEEVESIFNNSSDSSNSTANEGIKDSSAKTNNIKVTTPQKEVKQNVNNPDINKNLSDSSSQSSVNTAPADFGNNNTNNLLKKLVSIIDEDELANLSIYNELIDNLQKKALDSTSVASTVELEAPQFPISKVSSAKPYESNYVEYMLNVKRQQFNIQLQSATKRLNAKAENKILRLQAHGRNWFTNETKTIKDKYKINPVNIKKNINQEIIELKNDELEIEQKKINTRFENERNLVEQDYKAKLANIERDKSLAVQRLDHELANKYAQLEKDKIADQIKKAENHSQELIIEALKPRTEVINSDLTIKFNEIKEHIASTLKIIFDELQKKLPEYERQLQLEYLNAVETHAVEERAKDVSIQNQNVIDLNKKLAEQNENLDVEKMELAREIQELSTKLEELEKQLLKVPEQNHNQNKKINQQLVDLKVALEDKKKKSNRLKKEIVATGAIIAALGLGAGGAYGASQNSKTTNLKAENNRLRALKNLPEDSKKTDSQNEKESNNSKHSQSQINAKEENQNVNKSINNNLNESNPNQNTKRDTSVEKTNQNQNISNLINTLPKFAKGLIKNGHYTQAIKQYPEYSEIIEQKAFENQNLEGVRAANEVGTKFGTIDEAILSGSPSLIVSAYEASHISYLELAERANAVGRAYLKRNHYNNRENDYLSAVNIYNNNVRLTTLLKEDLEKFEVNHRLD